MSAESITVLCRIRPPNQREQGMPNVTKITNDGKTISIMGDEGEHSFNFDAVVDMDTTQEDVYNLVAAPVLEDVMKGYNGTIFAYGQTGSGKTFTMQGPDSEDSKLLGIIPRITNSMFDQMTQAPEYMEFLCRASLVEIYVEKIRDLFNPAKHDLKVREDRTRGIWIEGAEEFYVGSAEEALELLKMGQSHRAVTATKMNMESSRSHSIFILTLIQKNNNDGSTITSKLFLVDLAGSEKVRKTGAEGQTLEEAKTINKSLSALGNVINALTDGKSTHIPYRNSKLTRILQESLGGNARTALVINVSPASDNESETVSTCRFGARAKTVKNHAKMNLERSSAELKMLLARAEKEIERQRVIIAALEEEILILRSGGKLERESAVGQLGSLTMLEEEETDEEDAVKAPSDKEEEDEHSDNDKTENKENKEILAVSSPQSRPTSQRFTRTRSASVGIELEIKALEAQSAKKEEELVLLQDENDTLREQLEEKGVEIDRLEDEMKEHQERTRDLEEDAKNMRVELESAKYKYEEIAAELEAAQAQTKTLKNQVEELMAKSTPDLTSAVTKLIPELRSEPEAIAAENRIRTPSISAAEEAEKFVMQVENGQSVQSAAMDSNMDDLNEDNEDATMDEPEVGWQPVDLDIVKTTNDTETLRDLLLQQVTKMQEITTNRTAIVERKKALEKECGNLKSRMKKDMTDYKKWKAAVLVDLRSRIDRNIRLEISLDETKERYESLLKNSHDPSKKRLHFLEQSVQCLTKKCQDCQKQIEAYAAEAKVNETKLQRKNDRINVLELLLSDARDRNEKLRQELHIARGNDPSTMNGPVDFVPPPAAPDDTDIVPVKKGAPSTLLSSSSRQQPPRIAERLATANAPATRVAKPIRGGGGRNESSNAESGTVSSITSWFKRVVKNG